MNIEDPRTISNSKNQHTKPICDIIIPVWNQKERTERCLKSILQNTQIPIRLLLIDNASEKPTQEFLEQFKNNSPVPCVLIRNEENLGNVKGVNQGIQASQADFVLILDNDTLVFPLWLENMICTANSRTDIGIVNPGSNGLGYKKPWYLNWEQYAQKVLREEKGQAPEIATASGFCMLVKRALIEKIGGWSEEYGMGYYEDTDYSRRAYRVGYTCVHARDSFVYHEEHASFRKIKNAKEEIAAPNRKRFEEKYGIPKRLVYCLNRSNSIVRSRISAEAFELCRGNNWVTMFVNSSEEFPEYKDHGFIRYVMMWDFVFVPQCFIRVIKKKKKFDHIFTNDPLLFWLFQKTQFIHKSSLALLK